MDAGLFLEARGRRRKDVTGKKEKQGGCFLLVHAGRLGNGNRGKIQVGEASPTHILKKYSLTPLWGRDSGSAEAQPEACQTPWKIQNHRSLLDLRLEKHRLLLQLPGRWAGRRNTASRLVRCLSDPVTPGREEGPGGGGGGQGGGWVGGVQIHEPPSHRFSTSAGPLTGPVTSNDCKPQFLHL